MPIYEEQALIADRAEYNGGKFGYVDNRYPCDLFAQKELYELRFSKVTILYGGNSFAARLGRKPRFAVTAKRRSITSRRS